MPVTLRLRTVELLVAKTELIERRLVAALAVAVGSTCEVTPPIVCMVGLRFQFTPSSFRIFCSTSMNLASMWTCLMSE